jgi:hypothetical protein
VRSSIETSNIHRFARLKDKRYMITSAFLLVFAISGISIITVLHPHKRAVVHAAMRTDTVHNNDTQQPKATPYMAKVGGSITLTNQYGDKLVVVAEHVTLNATLTRPIITIPPSGDQLVAVQVRITDESEQSISDSAGADMTLYDTDGLSYQPVFDVVTNCQSFGNDNANFTVTPGSSVTGCEVFAIPGTATAGSVTFTPSGGMAADTGTWTVS